MDAWGINGTKILNVRKWNGCDRNLLLKHWKMKLFDTAKVLGTQAPRKQVRTVPGIFLDIGGRVWGTVTHSSTSSGKTEQQSSSLTQLIVICCLCFCNLGLICQTALGAERQLVSRWCWCCCCWGDVTSQPSWLDDAFVGSAQNNLYLTDKRSLSLSVIFAFYVKIISCVISCINIFYVRQFAQIKTHRVCKVLQLATLSEELSPLQKNNSNLL